MTSRIYATIDKNYKEQVQQELLMTIYTNYSKLYELNIAFILIPRFDFFLFIGF